ncbi:MAG: hypothetical protein ACOYEV_17890 [Candidatus Nanopelagicales bacterium]
MRPTRGDTCGRRRPASSADGIAAVCVGQARATGKGGADTESEGAGTQPRIRLHSVVAPLTRIAATFAGNA